jgi:hypothetical protein
MQVSKTVEGSVTLATRATYCTEAAANLARKVRACCLAQSLAGHVIFKAPVNVK